VIQSNDNKRSMDMTEAKQENCHNTVQGEVTSNAERVQQTATEAFHRVSHPGPGDHQGSNRQLAHSGHHRETANQHLPGMEIHGAGHRQRNDGSRVMHGVPREQHEHRVNGEVRRGGEQTVGAPESGGKEKGCPDQSRPAAEQGLQTETKTHKADAQGGFTETIESKFDGKKTVHQEDNKGNFTETQYDKQGNKIGGKTRKIHEDCLRTDTEYDKDGNAVTNRETKKDGSYNEQRQNPDGSLSIRDQDKDGNYKESTTKDGVKTGARIHKINDDKSVTDTDYDKDGRPLTNRETNKDGLNEQRLDPDGSLRIHKIDAGKAVIDTYDEDGKLLRTSKYEIAKP